ncbi:vWA domain-containing protein [Rhizobium sp. Root708]|uniref:vWA domain-containing protein n=1 Tax=Rhizobium sp. Root708 TaxID=1736592 RepID=UPI000AD50231|nr:VWA domain-containing protein [Rhizobium sp. Root708]
MDKQLAALSRLKAPAPTEEARARALSAALQSFDATEKTATLAQGIEESPRPSSILNRVWSTAMNRKFLASSAIATLLLVPAAGFVAIELSRNNPSGGGIAETPAGAVQDLAVKPLPKPTSPANVETETPAQYAEPAASPAPQSRTSDFNTDQISGLLSKDAPAALGAKRSVAQAVPTPPSLKDMDRQRIADTESDERFPESQVSGVKSVAAEPVSTFSADVDTASYSFVRRALMAGELPSPASVRTEEMINYFPYDWAAADTADQPFKATVTVMPTPWNAGTELLHVAIKGYDLAPAQAPPANLVFLIDVSGSMDETDKLPLLKSAFRLLVDKLRPEDKVSIVTYAGNAGTVLEPTSASDKRKILAAIDGLQPGGSTAGAAGIQAAYDLAKSAFVKEGVNRVMLATDGDFNVGPSSDDDLKALIENERKTGISLSVLGFGRGNLNDGLMQALAQNGNGTAAYIDTLAEAEKTLVQEASAALFPIAKDVKFQMEFNPARVAEYRLVGYETRALKREDFNNDRVDAGDIGSGHSVTAIYEITPKGSPAVLTDDLRYGSEESVPAAQAPKTGDELAFLKIRYKKPDENKSALISLPITDANDVASIDKAPVDVRFSTAVAAFGQKLRGDPALTDFSYEAVTALAENARGTDAFGYRGEFLRLVRLASGLSPH